MNKKSDKYNFKKLIAIISLFIVVPQTIGVIYNSYASTAQYDNMIKSDTQLNMQTIAINYYSTANYHLLDITTDILLSEDPTNVSKDTYNAQLNLVKEYIKLADEMNDLHNEGAKKWKESRAEAIYYINMVTIVNLTVFIITYLGLAFVIYISIIVKDKNTKNNNKNKGNNQK